MQSWVVILCKVADWLAYGGMIVPFLIAQRRRNNLTGGLRTLRFVPLFLFSMYGLMHVAIWLWQYSLPINHINTIGETLLYLKIYYDEFNARTIKLYIKIITVFFLIFSVADSFWLEGLQKINSYTNLLESTIVIFLGILFFEHSIIRKRHTELLNIPMFTATIGIILYLSGTIVMYLIANEFVIKNNEYNGRILYLANSCLMIIMGLLFCRAFLLVRPSTVNTD